MKTYDFKKDATYKAKQKPEVITVPNMLFVRVDGEGAADLAVAENPAFQQAVQVLYGIVYTLKFWHKKHETPPGYGAFSVAPLEGLWWMKNGGNFDMNAVGDWRWSLMLRVPEFVTPELFKTIVDELVDKKHDEGYRKARLEWFEEGESVQLMHVGPFDQEAPNIELLHVFAHEQGYKLRGRHHELYFGDPRRSAPEKLKTILRQPVSR